MRPASNERKLSREIYRCGEEINSRSALPRVGHSDVARLCLALSDWSAERKVLEDEKRRRAQRLAAKEMNGGGATL
jgi:hypothetical protein